MSNGYSFYLQKYPQGTTTFAQEDIEATYNCVYKQFKDFAFDGAVKNTYNEDYAEHSGVRTYIPAPTDLAFEAYDCKLQLLFKKATCQADVRRFYEAYRGQKCEYHDTFRNRYVTLLMTKQPTISQEKLYSATPYQLVEFIFSNILGETFATSQI